MKKKWIPLLLTLCMVMSLVMLPASAAEPTASGVYGIQTITMGAKVTPRTLDGQVVSAEQVTIDGAEHTFYPNAEQFDLTFTGNPNQYYFVMVCTGDLAAPDYSKVDYMNQYTADTDGKVSCNGLWLAMSEKPVTTGIHSVFVGGVKVVSLSYYSNSTGVAVKGAVQAVNPHASFRVSMKQGGAEVVGQDYRGAGQAAPQSFVLEQVPAGTYDLVVSMKGHTDYVIHNVVVGETDLDLAADPSKPYSTMALRIASLDGDDVVNSADLNLIWSQANYGKAVSEAQDAVADVNGDGVVNSADLNLLWSEENYGKRPADSEYSF